MEKHNYTIDILMEKYHILIECIKQHGKCERWDYEKRELQISLRVLLNDKNFEVGEKNELDI